MNKEEKAAPLKPCPFCGGRAKVINIHLKPQKRRIVGYGCDCGWAVVGWIGKKSGYGIDSVHWRAMERDVWNKGAGIAWRGKHPKIVDQIEEARK